MSDSFSAQVGQSGEGVVRTFVPAEYTVFVVDPDQRICTELTGLLERAGYRARAFHSAEEVLAALDGSTGKVGVISEIALPGITGLDLIARFREKSREAPIMILTSLSDVATAVRAMRERVSDYLVKPYVERDLINRLRTALLKQYAATH